MLSALAFTSSSDQTPCKRGLPRSGLKCNAGRGGDTPGIAKEVHRMLQHGGDELGASPGDGHLGYQ
jgi:hypothetical protein